MILSAPDEITLDKILDIWNDPHAGKRQVEDILDMLAAKKRWKDAGKDVFSHLDDETESKISRARDLRAEGYKYRDIALIMGVSVGAIHKYVKQYAKWREKETEE